MPRVWPLPWVPDTLTLQAATALIVKGGADAHLPDLSAARHTPLEAAVVSGCRALSHRLVILVNNRLKAEQKRYALLESFAVASREVQLLVVVAYVVYVTHIRPYSWAVASNPTNRQEVPGKNPPRFRGVSGRESTLVSMISSILVSHGY